MKPRTPRKASSKASHGLRSRHCVPCGGRTCPPTTRSGAGAARAGGQAAGRQDRVEERQAQGGQDGRGAQVALDPLEDGAEADQLARRVQVEQLVGQGLGAVRRPGTGRAASRASRRPRRRPAPGRGRRHRAAPGAARRRRAGRGRPCSGSAGRPAAARPPRRRPSVVDRPDDLVDDERPAAGRAARREQVADRDLEAGLAPRRGGHPLEGRVEMADVRRPQDDLGEHPGQRARFERDRPALAVDRGPGDPAAPPEQVGDDVARARCGARSGPRRGPAAAAARAGRRRAARTPGSASEDEARPVIRSMLADGRRG